MEAGEERILLKTPSWSSLSLDGTLLSLTTACENTHWQPVLENAKKATRAYNDQHKKTMITYNNWELYYYTIIKLNVTTVSLQTKIPSWDVCMYIAVSLLGGNLKGGCGWETGQDRTVSSYCTAWGLSVTAHVWTLPIPLEAAWAPTPYITVPVQPVWLKS
jgi:hypothetical protein